MKDLQVSATVPARPAKGDKPAQPQIGPFTITVKTGETAKEKIEMFGDAPVSSNADSNWTVVLQSAMRAGMRRGETQAQLQARLGGSKMGVAATKAAIDPKQAWLAAYQAATPAERKKMKADLLKQAESFD